MNSERTSLLQAYLSGIQVARRASRVNDPYVLLDAGSQQDRVVSPSGDVVRLRSFPLSQPLLRVVTERD